VLVDEATVIKTFQQVGNRYALNSLQAVQVAEELLRQEGYASWEAYCEADKIQHRYATAQQHQLKQYPEGKGQVQCSACKQRKSWCRSTTLDGRMLKLNCRSVM